MKHMAMNITTGEIMETRTGNQLKRGVALAEHFNRKYWGEKGRWIFAHGANAEEKLAAKWESKKVL